jgi:hypothetical protein
MLKFEKINEADLGKIRAINAQEPRENLKSIINEKGGSPTSLVMPHSTYIVGLDDLKNQDEPKPKNSGMRVIGATENNFSKIYDLHSVAGGGANEPQMLTDQKFIKDYENAFGHILGSEMEHMNYEVRLLKIPSLYIEAQWLHSDSGNADTDLYIPVREMELFKKNKTYNQETFFKILKQAAKDYDLTDDKLGG